MAEEQVVSESQQSNADRLLQGMTAGATVGPEGLFSHGSRMVVNASHVAKVDHENLKLIPLQEVFAEPGAVFLGFGEPNVYLATPSPSDQANWVKYNATMFWRQRSFVADTKGRVQGGVLVELCDLPAEALEAVRASMEELAGERTITCAQANARVLTYAGFTSGNKPLTDIIRPMALAERVWRDGLEWRNKSVTLRFIRTGERSLTDHFVAVMKKESSSLGRLSKKLLARYSHRSAAPVIEPRSLRPADELASPSQDRDEPWAELRMGRPSRVGAALGTYLGDHPIFEAIPDRDVVDLDGPEFGQLNQPLQAYPGRLSTVTKLKRYLLFAPGPVRLIRRQLAQEMQSVGRFTGVDLAEMLRTGTDDEPYVYNAIVTGTSLRLARLENRDDKDNRWVNWVLSKHVLIAGYDPDVRFAGECWVTSGPEGRTVHLNNSSGTYKPSEAQAEAAAKFVRLGFGVAVAVHPADEPQEIS